MVCVGHGEKVLIRGIPPKQMNKSIIKGKKLVVIEL